MDVTALCDSGHRSILSLKEVSREEKPHNPGSGPSNGARPPASVTVILDETGSLLDCKGAAIAGVNAYLATFRKAGSFLATTLDHKAMRRTMTLRPLILSMLLAGIGPAEAETGFSERYERDYNIFNPINRYQPDNPLNPAQAYSPDNPFNPVNRYDPGNPANPINRFNPDNPFNPINRYDPANPLNPINQYNSVVPFVPLDGGNGKGK